MEEKIKTELKEINMPKLDISKYVGKKERIASVDVMKGDFGYYLKLTTTIVDVLKGKEEKELRATRIFSLYTSEDGSVGWGSKSQLAEYLKLKRVSSPNELLGKEVVIQITVKNEKEFLTFI